MIIIFYEYVSSFLLQSNEIKDRNKNSKSKVSTQDTLISTLPIIHHRLKKHVPPRNKIALKHADANCTISFFFFFFLQSRYSLPFLHYHFPKIKLINLNETSFEILSLFCPHTRETIFLFYRRYKNFNL